MQATHRELDELLRDGYNGGCKNDLLEVYASGRQLSRGSRSLRHKQQRAGAAGGAEAVSELVLGPGT